MTERRPFCADLSRENDEPLGATASRIDRWILVEYRGLWTHDAVSGSGLSDQVKRHLREQAASHPHTRLLFIRRPDRRHAEGLRVYTADSRVGREELRRLDIGEHDDLRGIDLLGGAAGTAVETPLFLVCTHGKHDPCCAREGRPLFDALCEEADPDWVWQTTHVGGDRFAGNLVCLPEGLYYGRAGRADAARILDEHLAGRVLLDRYRGRSAYTFAVQAAERAVREQSGTLEIDEVTLEDAREDDGRVEVTFSAAGEAHDLVVTRELGDFTFLTCKAPTVQRPSRYVVTRR